MYLTPSLDRSGVQTRRSMARVPDSGYSDHHRLSALVFSFTRAGCTQCRHGEEKVSIPLHEHAVNAGLDRISAVVNMEEHY